MWHPCTAPFLVKNVASLQWKFLDLPPVGLHDSENKGLAIVTKFTVFLYSALLAHAQVVTFKVSYGCAHVLSNVAPTLSEK